MLMKWHVKMQEVSDHDHEEEHCEDFLTEADCGMHSECEWHADEMACEDAVMTMTIRP